MAGVDRFALPLTLRSPHPWSSVRITRMLGFRSWTAGAARSAIASRSLIPSSTPREPDRGGQSVVVSMPETIMRTFAIAALLGALTLLDVSAQDKKKDPKKAEPKV